MFEILRDIKKGDYVYAKVPNHPHATKNGYVLKHRVVVENHLGRVLEDWEVVHHKDGNKLNNDISNLEVLSQQEHARIHSSKGRTYITLVCPECGKEFVRELRQAYKGNKRCFCSRKCNGKFYKHLTVA